MTAAKAARSIPKTAPPKTAAKRGQHVTRAAPSTRVAKKTAQKAVRKSVAARSDKKMFVHLFRQGEFVGIAAVERIREGFPVQILKSAGEFFSVPDKRIYNVVRVPQTTATRLEKNNARIDAAATERVYRMAVVTKMAVDLFDDEAAAAGWIRQPNHALGDIAPLDLLDTEPGANAVKQVLNAIATGGAV